MFELDVQKNIFLSQINHISNHQNHQLIQKQLDPMWNPLRFIDSFDVSEQSTKINQNKTIRNHKNSIKTILLSCHSQNIIFMSIVFFKSSKTSRIYWEDSRILPKTFFVPKNFHHSIFVKHSTFLMKFLKIDSLWFFYSL